MKLRDVAKGTWAIKPVPFRLANAVEAAQPGQAPADAPVEVTLGVRVLAAAETSTVYEKAQEYARARGVAEWKDDHPICSLARMAFTLAVACVDIDSDPKAPQLFFENADEVFTSQHVGEDNIAYLFERWTDWQDACSIEKKNITESELIGILLEEATRAENADSPLDRMRPGLRKSYFRTTAVLFANLLTVKSDFGSPGESSSPTSKSEPAPVSN